MRQEEVEEERSGLWNNGRADWPPSESTSESDTCVMEKRETLKRDRCCCCGAGFSSATLTGGLGGNTTASGVASADVGLDIRGKSSAHSKQPPSCRGKEIRVWWHQDSHSFFHSWLAENNHLFFYITFGWIHILNIYSTVLAWVRAFPLEKFFLPSSALFSSELSVLLPSDGLELCTSEGWQLASAPGGKL